MAFDNFPYTDLHELNLDWLLRKVKQLEEKVTELEGKVTELEARIEELEGQ